MRIRILLVGVGLLGLASCAVLDLMHSANFAPLEEWRTLYRELEACVGRTRDFDRIEWEIRDAPERVSGDRLRVGHWDAPDHIWIAQDYMSDPGVLKHEMLHYLLQRSDHPSPPFGLCTEGF